MKGTGVGNKRGGINRDNAVSEADSQAKWPHDKFDEI